MPKENRLPRPTKKMNCRNTQNVGSLFTHLNTLEKSTKIPEGHTYTKYHSCKRRTLNSIWFENEKSHTPSDFTFPKLRFDTRSHKIQKAYLPTSNHHETYISRK